MLQLSGVPGIFCDAHLIDDGVPRFLSLWGRDTALQEFFARLSVSEREGGLRSFRIGQCGQDGACLVSSVDADRLVKTTARRSGTVFGELVHAWLYDRLAVEPDRANGRALLLHRDEPEARIEERLWALVRQTLWVPVLEHWSAELLALCREYGWIERLPGYQVGAWRLDLSDREAVEMHVSRLVRIGRLTLEPEATKSAAA